MSLDNTWKLQCDIVTVDRWKLGESNVGTYNAKVTSDLLHSDSTSLEPEVVYGVRKSRWTDLLSDRCN